MAQAGGVAHERIRGANLRERVFDRTQVAGAVIQDGDHSSPFVEGNWLRSRRSVAHAYFSARAKHLKNASLETLSVAALRRSAAARGRRSRAGWEAFHSAGRRAHRESGFAQWRSSDG